MSQHHSGSGDNVGIKIGRKISMGNSSTYIENDTDVLKSCLASWWEETRKHELFILVLCEKQHQIRPVKELSSIHHYYGNDFDGWKPFANETIQDLLKQYQEKTGFGLKYYSCNFIPSSDDDGFRTRFEDTFLPKIIVITDGLALDNKGEQFIQAIDYKNEIGGLLIPLDEEIEESTKLFIREKVSRNYSRMCERFRTNWDTPCLNIEIEVGRKEDFFRRLTNFVERLKIVSPNRDSALSRLYSKNLEGIESLTPDGNPL